MLKRGAGDTFLETEQTFHMGLGGRNQWDAHIHGNGRFVIDGWTFGMNNNLLTVAGGGVVTNGPIHVGFTYTGREGNYTNNVFEVTDGGAVYSTGEFRVGYSTSWTVSYNRCHDNSVRVASGTGKPSVWNSNNGNIVTGWQTAAPRENYFTTNNSLRLGFGGIVTNVNTVQIGNENAPDNRLSLEGGELFCNTLNIFDGNILAPALSPDGILPAQVAGTATCGVGAKVVPSITDDSAIGRYALVTADNIVLPHPDPNTMLAGLPENYVWRLRITKDAQTSSDTLWLTCSKPGTVFIIK